MLWIGQAFSLLGTSMALFAITFWIYKKTGQATPVALLGFFSMAPVVLLGLFSGALVDRCNRRLMILMSDIGGLLVNLFLAFFVMSGSLAVWTIYVAAFVLGVFQSFHWPAISSTVTVMVEKKHYGRAASLLEMAGMSSGILAPLLGGSLLGFCGLGGVLVLTMVGNVLAILSLSFIDLSMCASLDCASDRASSGHARAYGFKALLGEIKEGFRFLLQRHSLIGVQAVFLLGNFFSTLSSSMLGPFVLAKTCNNTLSFASVETAGAAGGLAAFGLIALSGGPRRKILGILGGWAGLGLAGLCTIGLGRGLAAWMAGSFLLAAFGSLCYASNQALWQSKVAPGLQGRVFAVRRLLAQAVTPVASLLAGPLIDRWLEPGMGQGGALSRLFGPFFGMGPGAGMALLFVVCGLMIGVCCLFAWGLPLLRHVENLVPDHDEPQAADA